MNLLIKPPITLQHSRLTLLATVMVMLSPAVLADSKLLSASTPLAVQKPQSAQKPQVIYAGRVRPELPATRHQPRIISESPGYHRYGTYPYNRNNPDRRSSSQRPGISARIYYQAPTTTTINRRVEVITPPNATGNVYFNQDTYYLYPPGSGRYYPARSYHQPMIPVTMNPQDTENRAKQWTDRSGFE